MWWVGVTEGWGREYGKGKIKTTIVEYQLKMYLLKTNYINIKYINYIKNKYTKHHFLKIFQVAK